MSKYAKTINQIINGLIEHFCSMNFESCGLKHVKPVKTSLNRSWTSQNWTRSEQNVFYHRKDTHFRQKIGQNFLRMIKLINLTPQNCIWHLIGLAYDTLFRFYRLGDFIANLFKKCQNECITVSSQRSKYTYNQIHLHKRCNQLSWIQSPG